MSVRVRTATLQDIDKLTRLFDAYRVFYAQPSDEALARGFLEERLRSVEAKIFLAEESNTGCLGFTQLFRSYSSVSVQQLWILNDLYVEQSARRKGVARQLMNEALNFARQTDSKGILLETANKNLGAQALYESLGYEKQVSSTYYFLGV